MSRLQQLVDEGVAILSIQGITPENEDAIVRTMDWLEETGFKSYTLLVIPFYRMKGSNSFQKHEFLADYLLSLDQEISLLGYSHMTKSGSLAEFRNMPSEQIRLRLSQARTLFHHGFGKAPVGFIPPLWVAPSSTHDIAKSLGFRYCVLGNVIHDLKKGISLETTHYLIGDRKDPATANAILELELGGPVQVSLHPSLDPTGAMSELVLDMKDRLGYRFYGYLKYLDSV